MKLTMSQALAASALTLATVGAHAADLVTDQLLTIDTGVPTFDAYGNVTNIGSGSYFAMDTNNNGKIVGTEKTALAQGTDGFIIGRTTAPGASHGGDPAPGDSGTVTAPWGFFGNTGTDFFKGAGPTGGTAGGIDMSGWRVTWNGIPEINMGTGAWGTGFTNGNAKFTWDGNLGSQYTLLYHATVPTGDPSGFGGVKYELFLTGKVLAPVPEAETWAMMLAGLGLVGGLVARRRKVLA